MSTERAILKILLTLLLVVITKEMHAIGMVSKESHKEHLREAFKVFKMYSNY